MGLSVSGLQRRLCMTALAASVLLPVTVRPADATYPHRAAGEDCPLANVTPLAAGETAAREGMYCLINAERRKAGRAPLTVNRRLAAEGGKFAGEMVTDQFFSHTDPQGNGLVERSRQSGYLVGYRFWALGENIGWGSGALGTPRAMMDALLASRGHRRNLLNARYRNMGVGVSAGIPIGGRFGATYVQQFGWRTR